MINFITQNISTIIVLLVVLVVFALVIFKMVKDKKNGKKSCNCGCGGCPLKDSCSSKK